MPLADAFIQNLFQNRNKSVFHFDPSIVFHSVVLLLKTVDRGGGIQFVFWLLIGLSECVKWSAAGMK